MPAFDQLAIGQATALRIAILEGLSLRAAAERLEISTIVYAARPNELHPVAPAELHQHEARLGKEYRYIITPRATSSTPT